MAIRRISRSVNAVGGRELGREAVSASVCRTAFSFDLLICMSFPTARFSVWRRDGLDNGRTFCKAPRLTISFREVPNFCTALQSGGFQAGLEFPFLHYGGDNLGEPGVTPGGLLEASGGVVPAMRPCPSSACPISSANATRRDREEGEKPNFASTGLRSLVPRQWNHPSGLGERHFRTLLILHCAMNYGARGLYLWAVSTGSGRHRLCLCHGASAGAPYHHFLDGLYA